MSDTLKKENPFKRIQHEKGWTIHQMAGITGSSVTSLQQIFAGAIKNPKSVIEALSRHGYDPVILRQEYSEWLQWKQSQR